MIQKQGETHQHSYTKKAFGSITLTQGRKTAKDKILYNMCVVPVNGKPCGDKKAYDIERTIL